MEEHTPLMYREINEQFNEIPVEFYAGEEANTTDEKYIIIQHYYCAPNRCPEHTYLLRVVQLRDIVHWSRGMPHRENPVLFPSLFHIKDICNVFDIYYLPMNLYIKKIEHYFGVKPGCLPCIDGRTSSNVNWTSDQILFRHINMFRQEATVEGTRNTLAQISDLTRYWGWNLDDKPHFAKYKWGWEYTNDLSELRTIYE